LAIDNYKKCIELESQKCESYYNLSLCYYDIDEYYLSITNYKICYQINPSLFTSKVLDYNLDEAHVIQEKSKTLCLDKKCKFQIIIAWAIRDDNPYLSDEMIQNCYIYNSDLTLNILLLIQKDYQRHTLSDISLDLVINDYINSSNDVICAICLEQIHVKDRSQKCTVCKHYLHKLCSDKWKSIRNVCPYCNKSGEPLIYSSKVQRVLL